ncbi:MAG: NAD-dependent epimerase/dehydratase family protein [Solirubrobacteraceae bacterium]|nr:MAG: epimerase [Solirubrobacterales bacterium]
MRILVTGASGFVGQTTCAELVYRGHEVSALVRRPGSQPASTQPVAGDLRDGERLRAAVAEAAPECVIHLAAEIASQRDAKQIREINVHGTSRLLAACANAGVRRVVFASTVVTGDAQGELLDEQTELPVETAYGASKQECERMLSASTMQWVVVRPSHVYGAGGWFAEEIVGRLRQPLRLAVVGRGNNWWDMVRVEDVAAAFALAAEHAPSGEIYHCADGEPITYYDFVALTAKSLGVEAPRRIPAWIARLAAGRDPIAAVTRSGRTSNAKLKHELGWTPRWPSVYEGVPDAVAALLSA